MQDVKFEDLGMRTYEAVWNYQEMLLKQNTDAISQSLPTQHHLLLVEHAPVYTLGKNGKEAHVLISAEERSKQNIEYFHINRGGDITFHGPGQIVGYPILDLNRFKTDLGWYLRSLEEVIILTLQAFGIVAERSIGETGVWIDVGKKGFERKICAMGIKCSRWVTMHGFALNVNTDLNYFTHIVPCGIQDKQVTSMQKELNKELDLDQVKSVLKEKFSIVFSCQLVG